MSQSILAALDRLDVGIDELTERRGGSQGPASWDAYANDPVGFFRDVLKLTPEQLWDGYVRVIDSVRENPQTVVYSAHAMGKDHLSAGLAVWNCYARRGLSIVLAPKDLQAVEILGKEIRNHWRVAGLPGEMFTRSLRTPWDDGGAILLMSAATDASKLSGFHWAGGPVLIIMSECQGLDPDAIDAAGSCAVGEFDRLLAVGNPVPTPRFVRMTRPNSGWNPIQLSAFDCPNVKQQRTVIPGAVTQAFIDRIRREFGEHSPQYQIKVLGEFPDEAEGSLIRRAWLERAAQRHAAGEVGYLQSWDVAVIGIDVSRFGGDKTIVAIRRGKRLVYLFVIPPADTNDMVDRIILELEQRGYNVRSQYGSRDKIIVDAGGLGVGIYDGLRKAGANADGYNSAHSPQKVQGVVHNRRAESYWGLRTMLERGELALPAHAELWEELLAVQWKFNESSGLIQIQAKDDIRSTLGRSPDYADACAMCFDGLWRLAGTQYTADMFATVKPNARLY